MSKVCIFSSMVTMLTILAPLHAQNGANAPGDFMAERLIALPFVVAPGAPNLPDAVLAGLQSGAIELHQRFTYNSAQRTIEQLSFIVPGNSPLPFPDPSGAPVGDHYVIQVDSATMTSAPRPSLVISGHVTSNDIITPFGDNTGAGVTLTIGYSNAGDTVQFGPILESVSPLYGLYSTSGAGSLSLTPSAQKCSAATLNGVYMFQLAGSVQATTGWSPYSESGSFLADGKGNITVLDSGNIAGTVFTGRTFPVAYVVNDDCTGSFTFGSSGMDIQLSRDGKAINMVFTKPSAVIANGVGRLQ